MKREHAAFQRIVITEPRTIHQVTDHYLYLEGNIFWAFLNSAHPLIARYNT